MSLRSENVRVGSSFCRSTNLKNSADSIVSSSHDSFGPGRKAIVLVVEDDPYVMRAAVVLIRRLGVEIWQATSAEEALLLIRIQIPSAILTDINLPGIDGLELCRRLKSDRRTTQIPILVWSGDPAHQATALMAGAQDFLIKPTDAMRVPELLQSILNCGGGTRAMISTTNQ